jgi:inosine/xanthosine triphosphate pyrophosphatase family protein
MKTVVLGTKNPAKVAQYTTLFKSMSGFRFISLRDLPSMDKSIMEPFDTAEQNAHHKAVQYRDLFNKDVFTNDQALYIDCLSSKEQPGTLVRRVNGGCNLSDQEVHEYYLKLFCDQPEQELSAYWRHAFCVATITGEFYEMVVDKPCLFIKEPIGAYTPGYPLSSLCKDPLIGKVDARMTKKDQQFLNTKYFSGVVDLLKKV